MACIDACAGGLAHVCISGSQHSRLVSSFRALYFTYYNSISVNLKLAVLNRKDGQEESQICLNSEVTDSCIPGNKTQVITLAEQALYPWRQQLWT